MSSLSRFGFALLGFLFAVESLNAVPVDSGVGNTISDRKNFIPNRKHLPLPGKIIAVLVHDVQPVLSLESRSGPADQICLGHNGGSYRWIYVPVEKDPMIPWLNLPVGPTGAEKKRFDKLSLASPATLSPLGVKSRYTLVELEVNGGLGSPADDSCVATKIKVLDGSTEFPLKVEQVIAELSKRYMNQQSDLGRDINVAMEKAATVALKDRKAPGNRRRSDVMFVTWIPETERLRVHFRTTISDGAASPMPGGDFGGRPRTMVARFATAKFAPAAEPSLPPIQFGVEFGTAYEVSKSGKVERVLTLPMETFQRDIKETTGFDRGGVSRGTMRKADVAPPPVMRTMKRP